MILVDEKKLGNALKACLSDSEFPLERRQAVLRAIRKEEKVMLDGFLAKYRKGDIVYPSAVARYLGIAVEKAYKLLPK